MTAHWGIPDPAAAEGSDKQIEGHFTSAFFMLIGESAFSYASPLGASTAWRYRERSTKWAVSRAMNYRDTRRWAVARLALGFLQMFGAVFWATLVIANGLTSLALTAALITGLLTLFSTLLFGGVISGMLGRRVSKRVGRKA